MDGFLSLNQAAQFLGISRPTFNVRRTQFKLNEIQEGRSVWINKAELLTVYAKEHLVLGISNLVVTETDTTQQLVIDKNTLDLRRINLIDAYGAISLLVETVEILEQEKRLYLVVANTGAITLLCNMGFFTELKRRFEGRVFWNSDSLPNIEKKIRHVLLPIKYIAYKGQERKYLEEEIAPLIVKQGYDGDTTGYLQWMLGELADNALTHAQGPCYVLAGQFSKTNDCLEIAIGDAGKGIFNSLKENPRYSKLSDKIAFIKAFQSRVSSWPDDKPRGKGLNDALGMAMGSNSLLRVDSKGIGFLFNFSNGQKELLEKTPATSRGGAKFCWVLINSTFDKSDRSEVDQFISREIEIRNG